MTGLLLFLLAVSIVVAWHELGHYLAFRVFGIPVTMFSVGVGPKLIGWTDKRGTTWKLSPFLIGGYVMADTERADAARPYQKFIIAAAGPFFNFIFVVVPMIVLGGAGRLWSLMHVLGLAYVEGFGMLWTVAVRPFTWVGSLFGAPVDQAAGSVIGPIGMAQAAAHSDGTAMFVGTLIMLNLALMLFNLLPVPILDGGRMVMAVIEGFFGQARTRVFERRFNIAGGLFMLYIFTIVFVSDFIHLFV
jgi:membrane-associated protease RseP (regulator of RpoE activity)